MPLASSRNSNLTCDWMILKDAMPSYFEHFGKLYLVRTKKCFIDRFFWLHAKMKHWSSSALRSGICMSSHRTPLRPGKGDWKIGRVFLEIYCSLMILSLPLQAQPRICAAVTLSLFVILSLKHPNISMHPITSRMVDKFQFSCCDCCPAGSSSYPRSLGFAEPVPWGFSRRCPLDELDKGMRSLKIVWWW